MFDITKVIGGKKNSQIGGLVNIAIVIIIIYLIVRIYKSFKAGSASVGDHLGNQVISVQTGVQAPRVAVLRQYALDLAKPIYRYWFTNTVMAVEDAPFVNILNKVATAKEAALLSQFFRENYGDSLKDILESNHISDNYKNMVTFRTNFA